MRASLVGQLVKNLPTVQETWVRFPGREDPLEKEMATHSSTLAGEFHGQRSWAGYSPWDWKESDTTVRLSLHKINDKFKEMSVRILTSLTTCCDMLVSEVSK